MARGYPLNIKDPATNVNWVVQLKQPREICEGEYFVEQCAPEQPIYRIQNGVKVATEYVLGLVRTGAISLWTVKRGNSTGS